MRLARGTRLVVATHNPGKVAEIDDLVRPYGLDAVSAGALGLPEPEENEVTFAGDVALKAVAAAAASGLPALSDDSGLEVECLGGEPGIYSARWAGPAKDFGLAMRKVADEVEHSKRLDGGQAGPNFASALCLAVPGREPELFEGKVFGHLVWPPHGDRGFGYDPMFLPDGAELTFGEMEPDAKHAISHRARAFARFVAACLG